MPSKKHGTVWPANPHTLAKIEMLKGYLNAYFPIFGRSRRGQNILVVDGFAGPGEYSNSAEGSPVAALRTAAAALETSGEAWVAGDIYCAFIESDPDRCKNLRERIQGVHLHHRVKPQVLEKNFVDGIAELRRTIPRPFTSADPLFVFIDPFGATGVPFETVASILSSPCSEVLINLDSDGIARNLNNDKSPDARDKILTDVFGDESWRTSLTSTDFRVQCQQVLQLYKQKLRSINRVDYVFSFEMRGSSDLINYHLVFASQNSLGLEKMKEAMRGIDRTGSYSFSDGHVDQITLFRFDHPEDFAVKLHGEFRGQKLEYVAVNKFALNETPFTNPISMLNVLDKNGQIEVERFDGKSKGFSDKHIKSVRFLESPRPTTSPAKKPEQGGLF